MERDQQKGVEAPPMQKATAAGAKLIDLVAADDLRVGDMPLVEVIRRRRSRRSFTAGALTLEELSFLLWATQGVSAGSPRLRTAPSAGARHPLETYLSIHRVAGLAAGVYRYLPLDHKLCLLYADDELPGKLTEACRGQKFVGDSAVVFIWTALPYRTEWRYSIIAHKMIAIDAGHVCQNLYLAAESIGAGTCGIGAYDHGKMDALLANDGVDGYNEFTVYAAAVGRIA